MTPRQDPVSRQDLAPPPHPAPRRPGRIAQRSRVLSGPWFYGDGTAAAGEMLDQGAGPIDVLTGDYLAELTMLILWKARRKDPSRGYAVTVLRQIAEVVGPLLE